MVGPCTHMHRINRAYIKAVGEKSLILQVTFSLFTFCALSSLLFLFLLRWVSGEGVVAARWPTAVGGGAAARTTSFLFFLLFSTSFLSLYSFLTLKIKESKPCPLDLNNTKRKRKKKSTFGSIPYGFGFRYGYPTLKSFPLFLLL